MVNTFYSPLFGKIYTVLTPPPLHAIPFNSSNTFDARIVKPICMIPLCIQMLATYLNFLSSSFEIIQILVIVPKNAISLNYIRNRLKHFMCMGGSYMKHISNGFYLVTFRSPSRMEILIEGVDNVVYP